VQQGARPPMALDAGEAAALDGPDTIDCIAPAARWEAFWRDAAAAKRARAPWLLQPARAAVQAADEDAR